jgi:hypothetical protein
MNFLLKFIFPEPGPPEMQITFRSQVVFNLNKESRIGTGRRERKWDESTVGWDEWRMFGDGFRGVDAWDEGLFRGWQR